MNLALGPSAQQVQWGLVLPAKEFAEQDAVLSQQLKIQEAEKKYGDICTAYVALTRAKKALYVVTTELGENTTSTNFARHLALQFHASSAQFGDPGWFADYEIKTPELRIDQAPSRFTPPLHRTPKPISPSSFKSEVSRGVAGDGVSRHAANLGIEVHEALAGIEWLETSIPDLPARSPEARKFVEEFLEKPLAREVFTKPEGSTRLWREQAFDVILDGQWVSGVFDRVVVHCDQKNNPLSAVIYDFKTDQGTNLEIQSRYAGQMNVYQKAVAKLLSIHEELVTFQVVAIR
jgi:ATP-dependent exoDNAse (exonuclease V) beta subunit